MHNSQELIVDDHQWHGTMSQSTFCISTTGHCNQLFHPLTQQICDHWSPKQMLFVLSFVSCLIIFFIIHTSVGLVKGPYTFLVQYAFYLNIYLITFTDFHNSQLQCRCKLRNVNDLKLDVIRKKWLSRHNFHMKLGYII